MPAPGISAFGDGTHNAGETGLSIDGAGFGPFAGEVWIFENADRTGASDQLTVGAWNDMQLSGVEIPAGPAVPAGARFLAVQRQDLAWSESFAFTLIVGATVSPANLAQDQVLEAAQLTQDHQLAPSNIVQLQVVQAVTLVIEGILEPQDIATIQAFGAVLLTQDHQLTAVNLAQLQVVEAPTAQPTHALTVADINQAQALEPVTLILEGQLQPLSIAQIQALEAGAIQQTHLLSVDDLVQIQVLGAPSVTPPGFLVAKRLRILPAFRGHVSVKPH